MTPHFTKPRNHGGAFRIGFAAFAVSLCISAIAVLILDARNQMLRLHNAHTENAEWSLSQWDAENTKLENALLHALAAPSGDLAQVRLQFDIFYSRTQTISDSRIFEAFRERMRISANMQAVQDFLTSWVPVIDGPPETLRAQLSNLLEDTTQIHVKTREAVLAGAAHFAQNATSNRAEVGNTLLRVAVLTVVLVVLLLLLVGALLQLVRRRANEARRSRAMQNRMETIIATTQDAVVVINTAGLIVEFNGAAEKMFGYRPEEALFAPMANLLIPPFMRDRHNIGLRDYMTSGESHFVGQGVRQLVAMRKDRSTFPVDVTLTEAESHHGRIFIAFMRDITDRVKVEAELRQARDRALAGERHKAELLAVMSHEMRTPLNGLLGTMELFDTDNLQPHQQKYLQIMRTSGEQLLTQVNDVLDVSRLDAGKLVLHKVHCNIVDLMHEVVDNQAGAAQARGNTLRLTDAPEALQNAYTDPTRLRQVLLNLVSNAVKFTSDGEISLEAELIDGLDSVEIRITDTGVGISEDDLARVFDDFVTIDSSYARTNTGTGLGLAISRRLTQALGGELQAESIEGEGSIFWLRLPLSATQAPTARPMSDLIDPQDAKQPPLPALSVLLVEDNEVNRMVTRTLLERDGHQVTEAHDGFQGIEMARQFPYDVIFMDISMPGMDGVSATREIRTHPHLANVPIIATTAHAMPNEVRSFEQAGMSGVLTKPVMAQALDQALRAALDRSNHMPQHTTDDSTPAEILSLQNLSELTGYLKPGELRKSITAFEAEMALFLSIFDQDSYDHTQTAELAHRMAGSAGVFGALRLAQLLRALQTALHDQQTETVTHLQQEAKDCWEQTQAALHENETL
jgi:PAS domain S-box-containing protein